MSVSIVPGQRALTVLASLASAFRRKISERKTPIQRMAGVDQMAGPAIFLLL